jgi:hypothetical protein
MIHENLLISDIQTYYYRIMQAETVLSCYQSYQDGENNPERPLLLNKARHGPYTTAGRGTPNLHRFRTQGHKPGATST